MIILKQKLFQTVFIKEPCCTLESNYCMLNSTPPQHHTPNILLHLTFEHCTTPTTHKADSKKFTSHHKSLTFKQKLKKIFRFLEKHNAMQ